MLSRFNLKPEFQIQAFRKSYNQFVERLVLLDLAVETGKIGRRIHDTPMDTDATNAPEYYCIMTFRNRDQLDRAYAYIADGADGNATKLDLDLHHQIYEAVENPVFTCWQD